MLESNPINSSAGESSRSVSTLSFPGSLVTHSDFVRSAIPSLPIGSRFASHEINYIGWHNQWFDQP